VRRIIPLLISRTQRTKKETYRNVNSGYLGIVGFSFFDFPNYVGVHALALRINKCPRIPREDNSSVTPSPARS
jgi:hypothetical protein